MMMYEGSGLEEEADYDQEYEIEEGSLSNAAPIYYPMPQTTERAQSIRSYRPATNSHQQPRISQDEYKPGPTIHQVFEDPEIFDIPADGAPTWTPSDHDYTSNNHVEPRLPPDGQAAQSPMASTSSSSLASSTISSDTNSVSLPTKKASFVPGANIPMLPMPMTRIPKKKKPQDAEQVPNGVMLLSNVDIASEDGWNRAYTLLQQVEKANDTSQIIQLLKIYLKADTSLLTARLQENSNDTAKLIRKLSKNHENDEVKTIASQCVTKWKKEINGKVDKSKKEKSSMEDKAKKSEKRRLSDENEKKKVKKTLKDDESPEAKKRKVEESKRVPAKSGFMDALASAAEVPKKKQVPRKKPDPKVLVNDPLSVLDLIEKKNKPVEPMSSFPPLTQRKSPTPPRVEDDIPVKLNRKIKFADEMGKEMVQIRYFEVEEGERINVNRMTPEDMKHHEAMMERTFKQDAIRDGIEEEEEKEVSWRCLTVDVSEDDKLRQLERGSKSEAKLEEERRQSKSLRAFCDPTQVFYITADPEDWDPRVVFPDPVVIPVFTAEELQKMRQPVLPISVPTPTSSALAPTAESAVLPDNLKNLLAGLKQRGIMKGDDTGTSSAFSGLTAPVAVPPYVQAPIAQSQYQVPQQTFQPFHPQISQFQPQQQSYVPVQHHFVPHRGHLRGPGSSEQWTRQTHLCHQFKAGHCRYGDQCRFSHDMSLARPDNNRFRGSGRGRPQYDRRDFRDRRDFGGDRDHREDRSRDWEHSSRHEGSPPRSAQSPNIRSPTLLSPKSTEPTVIPSERSE